LAKALDPRSTGQQDYPALPVVLPERVRHPAAGKPTLPDGCYFIAYGFAEFPPFYVGTLRVDSRSGELSASGDLYEAPALENDAPFLGQVPPPSPGVPIFPIPAYTYYLRVTGIEATDSGFTLAFEASRFLRQTVLLLDGDTSSQWLPQGSFTAQMMPAVAPEGYPSPELFFTGDIAKEGGTAVAMLQMGWVSPLLRKAVIEIDRVPEAEVPLDNGAGLDWRTVFNGFGWDVTAALSDSDVQKYGKPMWTGEEARAAMVARRDSSDLDAEWRYHVLVGQNIFYRNSEQRGAMYDETTRQGLFVSSHIVFSAEEERWGPLKGLRAGESALTFFRTAVHELGHAMGLGHDDTGFHIMRPTDGIADDAPAEAPFPTNILMSFAPDDAHRLRHWPDMIVRPGGTSLLSLNPAPLSD
jgi:hypothetical protein